ncbi:hypothetical protein GCM10010405_34090 [Streptomyces macrosporus]|uniref:Uncharacterized protein n=1 Tax=Streptomyces macrosporus TaxID=44032 RepID=A0ABN3K2V7_9ACTN
MQQVVGGSGMLVKHLVGQEKVILGKVDGQVGEDVGEPEAVNEAGVRLLGLQA